MRYRDSTQHSHKYDCEKSKIIIFFSIELYHYCTFELMDHTAKKKNRVSPILWRSVDDDETILVFTVIFLKKKVCACEWKAMKPFEHIRTNENSMKSMFEREWNRAVSEFIVRQLYQKLEWNQNCIRTIIDHKIILWLSFIWSSTVDGNAACICSPWIHFQNERMTFDHVKLSAQQ